MFTGQFEGTPTYGQLVVDHLGSALSTYRVLRVRFTVVSWPIN